MFFITIKIMQKNVRYVKKEVNIRFLMDIGKSFMKEINTECGIAWELKGEVYYEKIY